jgi:hypothetical protein
MTFSAPADRAAVTTDRPTPPSPIARADVGGVHDRADAGEHRAAEQRGLLQRRRGRQRDDGRLGDDDLLGERAEAERHVQRRAVRGRPALGGGRAAGLAEPRLAVGAEPALPAGRRPVEDDVVADGHPVDSRTDLGHHPGGLVPQDQRERRGQGAVRHRQVGVAHARGADPDADLAGAGRREFDVLDAQFLPRSACHQCLDH